MKGFIPKYRQWRRIKKIIVSAILVLCLSGTAFVILPAFGPSDSLSEVLGFVFSLLNNSASAFGSSIYGMLLTIVAYKSLETFKNLPIQHTAPNQEDERE